MAFDREAAREQAREVNALSMWAIRAPCGLYFGGFGGKPGTDLPSVKWESQLSQAKFFNATALSQAEKYIERIKAKDSLYVGLKVVKVALAVEGK